MDETVRAFLLTLGARVGNLLALVPDEARERLRIREAQRLAEAEAAVTELASSGVPADASACWRIERALGEGLEVVRRMKSEADVGRQLTDAWVLLRDDITSCRFRRNAGAPNNWKLELNSPSDDSVH